MRAALFAAVCLALSVAGHWWMSGQGIPVRALVVAYAAVLAVALVLTGRERSFSGIATVVLLSELGLHLYFSSAQAWTGTSTTTAAASARASMPMDMGSSHAMAGMAMAGMGGAMPMGSTHTMAPMGHGPWGMLAVHVAAGLISAWWLRRGEASVFAVLRVVATAALTSVLRFALFLLALAFGTWTPTVPVPPRARDAWLLPQPGRCALLDVVVRRGPPAAALVG
ncbi:hypothetical protein [Streptacidiphilus albus]|nr:hypothetical protein [Streptacidiphilus albus]